MLVQPPVVPDAPPWTRATPSQHEPIACTTGTAPGTFMWRVFLDEGTCGGVDMHLERGRQRGE